MEATQLDRTFAALADGTRRLILERLGEQDLTAGALAEPMAISRPAVSRHLRVLREAELVTVRIDGRERWFSINPDGVVDADTWLEDLRRMWRDSLFALKSFVEGGET
jgi:DNA-binding transcriptional ArsR family regulator